MPNASLPLGVIFDMDGVIVNNLAYHLDSWDQFLQHHRIDIQRDEILPRINGRTAKDIFEDLFGRTMSDEEVATLSDQKEGAYRELYRPHLALSDGLQELLDALRAQQVPMAVGTSAPPDNVVFTLDGLQVRKYFKGVTDASQVTKGKPHPEVYLNSAKIAGVEPRFCVVIEDAKAGVEAALNAGMSVVAITSTHRADELGTPHLLIDSFRELTVEKLRELVAARNA
ncbi:haloacid dehalogenase superfamily, subfamily IA, variant 3 with third motif having DD or ED/beta-phosphoglucomutase family hydrolase [Catalinimonas alkaloidigena]|uniref:Haloacid dehalogenase superfamily, subfamily IA, variant 3 with third motif having DD or ED/beta-phosphoglucomutase family hydrolase n=1 Tax=Catalinimonas alkaloidigena TaxID=1075417 RepID=A0A1G9HFQ4_9BACT|nr:HAD family phosphatase [Catalinimonas alkaloidigena]SDL11881.1 haloacid dehalogenase superfamily, subfamily IA, variant 3 with third motif having DD or ED/beta-phosphoglucomutase family hydrolase [Catalinimonas alkaloidigena]